MIRPAAVARRHPSYRSSRSFAHYPQRSSIAAVILRTSAVAQQHRQRHAAVIDEQCSNAATVTQPQIICRAAADSEHRHSSCRTRRAVAAAPSRRLLLMADVYPRLVPGPDGGGGRETKRGGGDRGAPLRWPCVCQRSSRKLSSRLTLVALTECLAVYAVSSRRKNFMRDCRCPRPALTLD